MESILSPRSKAILIALALQLGLIFVALTIGILQPEPQKDSGFQVSPQDFSAQQTEAVRQQMQEFQQWSSSSAQIQRLTANAMLAESLPQIDMPAFNFNQPEMMTGWESFTPIGMAQAAGIWDAQAATGGSSSVSLFGLQTEATRVVIAFDISSSVKTKVERAGLSMERIRDQTWSNLESMNANTLFGLIQFARASDSFETQLRPATQRHLTAAQKWLDSSFRVDGSSGRGWQRGQPDGIEAILKQAFELDRRLDTLIVISDGDFYRTTPRGGGERVPWTQIVELTRKLQASLENPCSIHLIAFDLPAANRSWAREWVRQNSGQLIEIQP
ncbi:MAG: hypothetical protein JJU20_12090 [Opitutales bacterium]|nr:hypothetical protein [Opitutales bacterium]